MSELVRLLSHGANPVGTTVCLVVLALCVVIGRLARAYAVSGPERRAQREQKARLKAGIILLDPASSAVAVTSQPEAAAVTLQVVQEPTRLPLAPASDAATAGELTAHSESA